MSFLKIIALPAGLLCLSALVLLAGYWVERLRWAVIALMMAIVLFLLAGVIPSPQGVEVKGLFQSSFFMFLAAVLAMAMVWACFRRRPALSQIPFWMAHAGVALALGGAAVDHFWGKSHQLVMPLHEPPSKQFQNMDKVDPRSMMGGGMTEMPFMMRLGKLDVFSYDPKAYQVYRSGPTSDGKVEFKPAGQIAPQLETMKGRDDKPVQIWTISLAKIPGLDKEWAEEKIPVGQLVPGKGTRLRKMVPLGELSLACDPPPPDKTIDAKLEFNEGKEMVAQDFTVNHPAAYKGWRFYMMSYDTEQFQWAMITARHDPGRGVVIAGLWLVILGVAGICFWRPRNSPPASPNAPAGPGAAVSQNRFDDGPRRHRPRRRRSGGSGQGPTPPAPREGGN
jgi:hypothetical protein